MVVGCAIVGMLGKSFMEGRGRASLPVFIALALISGLIMGWALNAWIDYIHFTSNGGGGGM